MTATAAPSARPAQIAFPDLGSEIASTKRILERVPDAKLDWAPHGKSMTLGRLANHLAELPLFALSVVSADEFDFAKGEYKALSHNSAAAIQEAFDKNSATLRSAIEGMDWAAMERPWTLRNGQHVVVTGPRGALVRSVGINHIIHHRAQLSVYLRLLEVPVPGLYGPSADDRAG